MCGIAGFCDYNDDLSDETLFWGALAKRMGSRLKHRGPDDSGIHVSSHAALAHARLAVVDIEGGKQPMTAVADGLHYTIVYNGELYNSAELRDELKALGLNEFCRRHDPYFDVPIVSVPAQPVARVADEEPSRVAIRSGGSRTSKLPLSVWQSPANPA